MEGGIKDRQAFKNLVKHILKMEGTSTGEPAIGLGKKAAVARVAGSQTISNQWLVRFLSFFDLPERVPEMDSGDVCSLHKNVCLPVCRYCLLGSGVVN